MNVLLTGGAGYVGRRLADRLLEDSTVRLRMLVSDARTVPPGPTGRVEIVEGDPLDSAALRKALEGIEVAYYPVRFFSTVKDVESLSRSFATQFRDACVRAGVRRIVYLGIAAGTPSTSGFLRSMEETGAILTAAGGQTETLWLRTGVIVGPGSVLLDVLRHLAEQSLPVIPATRWMEGRSRPVGLDGVVDWLARARDLALTGHTVIDIEPDDLSFRDMLGVTAEVLRRRKAILPVPLALPRLSALYLMLVTPLSYRTARMFIEALGGGAPGRTAAVEGRTGVTFKILTPTFRQLVTQALLESRQQPKSRWIDSLTGISYAFSEEEIARSIYRDQRRLDFGNTPPERIFREVTSIGGKKGWFAFDVLWQIRGLMDKLMGGFGTSIGRRADADLRVGDILDVWRVLDVQENKRLLLGAQMKVFGEAWLEYRIEGTLLIQTAYHLPIGLLGRLYWYSMLPFHAFIFRDMIASIVTRARES